MKTQTEVVKGMFPPPPPPPSEPPEDPRIAAARAKAEQAKQDAQAAAREIERIEAELSRPISETDAALSCYTVAAHALSEVRIKLDTFQRESGDALNRLKTLIRREGRERVENLFVNDPLYGDPWRNQKLEALYQEIIADLEKDAASAGDRAIEVCTKHGLTEKLPPGLKARLARK
jgi:hypothetical protein